MQLPWFKFSPERWFNGMISLNDNQTKGLFIDICCYYWSRDCELDLATIKRRFSPVKASLDSLINDGVITVKDEKVNISFLDDQVRQFEEKTKALSEAGRKGAKIKELKRQGRLKGGKSQVEAKIKPPISNKDKEEDKEKEIEYLFESSRKIYPGKKRGLDTEFTNFKKKHKDWETVIELLVPAIKKQESIRVEKIRNQKFVPEWKNFQTWINQRCWEDEESVNKPFEQSNEPVPYYHRPIKIDR